MDLHKHIVGDWYHGHRGSPQHMNIKLDQELLKLLYKQAVYVSISLFALLCVALYFFWGELPKHLLLGWAAINFSLNIVLLLLVVAYRRHAARIENPQSWTDGYIYLTMLQDIAWGLIGPLSFMVENDLYHLLTLFMLGGMSAGAIATRGVVFKAYFISITSLLTPVIITLGLQGDTVSDAMLVLTVIYLLFMLSVAKSYSDSIRKNILLWLDNEKLVEQLRDSKALVEEANHGLTREIKQRMIIEDELVEAKERAERASAVKNQFLASVSHELRTPLNGIIGFASILEKEQLPFEQQGYVSQIGKSANTLLRIVNDILDITSIEAGRLKLYEESFSLRTEIGEVEAILRPMAQQKQLVLISEIDRDVSDWIEGDPNRLRQVISNLLSNALKYTNDGQVKLHISQVRTDDSQVVLRFEVTDTGIGIPEESLNTLFDSFTRVESFETRHTDGVGLGLAIVRNLLHAMHGTIDVKSRPGEGSCFSVELPFRYGTEVPEKSEGETGGDERRLQRLKVLVVDDNYVNRLVLTTFLKHNGIGCREAESGAEALQLIQDQDFDLVLLDIQMPDLSGVDVASRVMGMDKDIPVLIAVTAHAFPEQREAIIKAGFTDFLIKPVSESELLKILTRIRLGERGGRAGKRAGL